jgi:hypothetical protein
MAVCLTADVSHKVETQAEEVEVDGAAAGSTRKVHSGGGTGLTAVAPRVRISVRLERQALTDAQLELFTRWYQVCVCVCVCLCVCVCVCVTCSASNWGGHKQPEVRLINIG